MKIFAKKVFFYVTTILIPVVIILSIELLLRLFHFGEDQQLILIVRKNNIQYYQLNPEVGKRYFFRTDENLIPQLYPQIF